MRNILDFLMQGGDPMMQPIDPSYQAPMSFGQTEETPGMAQQILSNRFQPTANDAGNAALMGIANDTYVDPQGFVDQRTANAMKQLSVIAELKKLQKGTDFDQLVNTAMSLPEGDPRKQMYMDRINKETTVTSMFGPIAGVDPATGAPAFGNRGQAAAGGLLPPPPAGMKYKPGTNQLMRSEPSTRDQMRLGKSVEAASAAGGVERIGTEVQEILGRYNTNKAAPILGKWEQYLNVIGMADKQKVQDYELLDKRAKELGAMALQQFGGNDTDKELQIAIQSNIDPGGTVGANAETVGRKVLAAQILQQRPIFEEEWLNKTGSLTEPDPDTGETFSRAWMRAQKAAWADGLAQMQGGQGNPSGITPPTPEEEAEYKRYRQGGSGGGM